MCIKNAIFCKKRWSVRVYGGDTSIFLFLCVLLYIPLPVIPFFRYSEKKNLNIEHFLLYFCSVFNGCVNYIFGEFYSRTTLLVLVRLISNRRGTLASCLSSLPGKNTDLIFKINNFTTILVQKSFFDAKFLINCNAHC